MPGSCHYCARSTLSGRRWTAPRSRRTRRLRAKGELCGAGDRRSRGGPATRIAALVDALGYLVRFELVPGQAHDLAGLPPLPGCLEVGALIGDRAFDAGWLIEKLEARGGAAAISSKSNRKAKRSHDREMYAWRRQIENFFAKIKEFRAIATRGGKTVAGFRAIINLVEGVIAAR
ncbi:MAG: transposase [Albidovulum sp.]|nr:transposase [Albidovulum sp.]